MNLKILSTGDMKMLAMLAGELTNSAKYFSSFGNVSTADCTDLTAWYIWN